MSLNISRTDLETRPGLLVADGAFDPKILNVFPDLEQHIMQKLLHRTDYAINPLKIQTLPF